MHAVEGVTRVAGPFQHTVFYVAFFFVICLLCCLVHVHGSDVDFHVSFCFGVVTNLPLCSSGRGMKMKSPCFV